MSAVSRTRVLGLYRSLLKESFELKHYNVREYALRSVRTRFRENMRQRKTGGRRREVGAIRTSGVVLG